MKVGIPGTWNSSESGHPHLFRDEQGSYQLFFRGNDAKGQTWWLASRPIRPPK